MCGDFLSYDLPTDDLKSKRNIIIVFWGNRKFTNIKDGPVVRDPNETYDVHVESHPDDHEKDKDESQEEHFLALPQYRY